MIFTGDSFTLDLDNKNTAVTDGGFNYNSRFTTKLPASEKPLLGQYLHRSLLMAVVN